MNIDNDSYIWVASLQMTTLTSNLNSLDTTLISHVSNKFTVCTSKQNQIDLVINTNVAFKIYSHFWGNINKLSFQICKNYLPCNIYGQPPSQRVKCDTLVTLP